MLPARSKQKDCTPDKPSLTHEAGECPWCDQARFDLHVQAKVARDDYEDRYGRRPDMSEFC